MRYIWVASTCGLAILSAQTPTYTGSRACASCHPSQFRLQSASSHARALYPAAQHPLASVFPLGATLQRKPSYSYRFTLTPNEFHVSVYDAKDIIEVPIQWAFGAGDQAVTFVSRIDRDWYVENYFSYYPAIGKMSVTPGQRNIEPKTLPEAVGLVYKSLDPQEGIVRCFRCHSTGPLDTAGGSIRPSENGVHCEACHGPGSLHARSSDRKQIANPRRMTASELNTFCGECHRPPAAQGTQIDWNFSWNVRHQPVYLSESACFRKSKGALSCLSCHAAHENLNRNASDYNHVCSGCHASAHSNAQSKTNCIDCHMPRISPEAPLRFTNHWIGIYATGSHLKPVSYE